MHERKNERKRKKGHVEQKGTWLEPVEKSLMSGTSTNRLQKTTVELNSGKERDRSKPGTEGRMKCNDHTNKNSLATKAKSSPIP